MAWCGLGSENHNFQRTNNRPASVTTLVYVELTYLTNWKALLGSIRFKYTILFSEKKPSVIIHVKLPKKCPLSVLFDYFVCFNVSGIFSVLKGNGTNQSLVDLLTNGKWVQNWTFKNFRCFSGLIWWPTRGILPIEDWIRRRELYSATQRLLVVTNDKKMGVFKNIQSLVMVTNPITITQFS